MLNRPLEVLGKILVRLSRWPEAAWVLCRIRPLWAADEGSVNRLVYVSLFVRDKRWMKAEFAGLLRRELDHSAAHNLALATMAWRMDRTRLAHLIFQRTERRFPGDTGAAIAGREKLFLGQLLGGELREALAESLTRVGVDQATAPTICVVFLSTRYVDMYRLWLEQFRAFGTGHLIVCALDAEAAVSARADVGSQMIDLSQYFVPDSKGELDLYGKRHLWIVRVMLLQLMLERGFDFISFDLDALPVSNLDAMFARLPKADVVVQKDYSIPVNVARKLGFVLCCGFLAVRSNGATVELFRRYSRRVAIELDDQHAINHLLEEAGVANQQSHAAYMSFSSMGVEWICPDASLVSRDIAYGSVVRHFQRVGQSIEELKRLIATNTRPLKP